MTEKQRTLEQFYNTVKDRLGVLHNTEQRYQEATFMADAKTVGIHIHALLTSAGERFWDKMTAAQTVEGGTESSSLLATQYETDVSKIRRIWVLDDNDQILQALKHRSVDRTDVWTGDYPTYEFIENKVYWFPSPAEAIKVKVEYISAYDSNPEADDASGPFTDDIDSIGNAPDIPVYADDYFLNELTARAAMALGMTNDIRTNGWLNLARRSRESMILNASRDIPRRKHVLYRGY